MIRPVPLRLLPEWTASGPRQMALDEALLATAETTTLRTYRWDPPAVSLGYFQEHARVAATLPPGIAMVRRITGGGAIWHEHEITYAVAGRLGQDGLPTLVKDLYPLLHGAVLRRLAGHGASLAAQTETVGDRRYAVEPRCFASPAADDLIHLHGGKVLGSAARARGERVLIHGSLKLASNPWDQSVTAGCGLPPDVARRCLVEGIAEALGLTAELGTLSDAEEQAARAIETERYATTDWVLNRAGPRP